MGDLQLWLTDRADVRCTHKVGKSPQQASQHWVTIGGDPILVAPDPVGRPVQGCPNVGVSIKPCTNTLSIRTGQSAWVRIGGRPVIRADLTGFTDGTPPGEARYTVIDPAQRLVGETP